MPPIVPQSSPERMLPHGWSAVVVVEVVVVVVLEVGFKFTEKT